MINFIYMLDTEDTFYPFTVVVEDDEYEVVYNEDDYTVILEPDLTVILDSDE